MSSSIIQYLISDANLFDLQIRGPFGKLQYYPSNTEQELCKSHEVHCERTQQRNK